MYDNKNLSKEFKATVEETKGLLMATAMESSVSTMDADDIVTNVKALRLLDLSCAMFEKQDKLMDKMDKAMDKYLKEN